MKTPKPTERVDPDVKKKMLTLFILFFPSIIIAGVPSMIDGSIIKSLVIKLALVFYQFVVLKNFIDQHYGE